jgi:hypothetical protein
VNAIDESRLAPYVERVRLWRDTLLQFMILLSALLASLSGLVAGERAPVRAHAQVQASAFVSAVEAEATAVAFPAIALVFAGLIARLLRRAWPTHAATPQLRLATRLALKQSWLN